MSLGLWWLCFLVVLLRVVSSADLVIRIPGDLSQQDGYYRLYYQPEVGFPLANTTFRPQSISDKVIKFSRGLPGTKYDFWLYYSNSSISDFLTWTASITTAPDPPSNLSISVRSGDSALIRWRAPSVGGFSGFKLKVIPLSEAQKNIRNIVIREDASPFQLRDLTPGATYEIQLFTVYENKESAAYISTNFTTQPNTPGRFIVWFRNETTLLVLWQPPYPAGVYSDYKVSIDPSDADVSETYVARDGDPPGPAQAAFNGLIPGRAYNISVETVSQEQISEPTTAQYRTVPWRPHNVSFDEDRIGSTFFEVRWSGPREITEFDRYQVAIGIRRKTPQIIERGAALRARFTENLKPGLTYQVVVKTVSGSVASWPATGNVTTRPLPVLQQIETHLDEVSNEVTIAWQPDEDSFQDRYKVTYHEVETFNGDSSHLFVEDPFFSLSNLQPGRNYSIAIQAVAKGMESAERSLFQATRPASPIIEDLTPTSEGLNISWKSDVTSRQDKYVVVYVRNDTGQSVNIETSQPRVAIDNLYPGAGYNVKVYALSHGLLSEPHISFKSVFPRPIGNLSISQVVENNVFLSWLPPLDSLYTAFTIRHRPVSVSSEWELIEDVTSTEYVLRDVTPGEELEIEVNSVSHFVASQTPLTVTQKIRPQRISDVIPSLGAENVTLQWPKPQGRVDVYKLKWYPRSNPEDSRTKSLSPPSSSSEQVSIEVTELHPGVDYLFEISSLAHSLSSEVIETSVRTRPVVTSELNLINRPDVTTSLTVRYTSTALTNALFDTYRFALSDDAVAIVEKAAQDPERVVVFDGLTPGRLYNVSLWTVSGGVTSEPPLIRQDRLHPEPVQQVRAIDISDKSITLVWNEPQGEWDSFEVQYEDDEAHLVQETTTTPTISLLQLRPFRNYTFTLITKSGSTNATPRRSLPVTVKFQTEESVPGSLSVFKAVDVQPSSITFEWELSHLEANGIITGFVIQYGGHVVKSGGNKEAFKPRDSKNFGPNERSGRIDNLVPGQRYTFQMQARTQVGYGAWVRVKQEMPIWAPPTPPRAIKPTTVGHDTHTITVRFRRNFFSDENGRVVAYAVIVAEDFTKSTHDKPNLPKWQDVQQFRSWPPYQISDAYYPFNNSSWQDAVVGLESNCELKKGYCNGPLKPGTEYRIKIRAHTTRDKYSETEWSVPIATDPDNTAFLVLYVVAIVLVILVLVTIFVVRKARQGTMCMRNRRGRKLHGRTSDLRGGVGVSGALSGALDSISLPDSVIETSRPVKLKDFAEHYRIMSADSDFRFSEEYEELKHVGREKSCSAADMPVNRPKNRFTNILPYDHSRVKLQPTDDEEGSDYINANYVPGHNSPREFIVTQGPLHSTRDDFWRMCWETNCKAIIMLTKCVEKGREKCDHYWPYDTQPVYYGEIQVTILNESHFPDWNIAELRMMRGDTVRSIKHFHFTTWPDFGVPEPPQTLVRFVRAYRHHVSPEMRPVAVHCSAGVGRSGTFMAIDRILQQIEYVDVVDIYGIVYEMRRERVWMVQTEQQYICIHQCLLAVLEGRENEMSNRELHDNAAFDDDEGIAESGM